MSTLSSSSTLAQVQASYDDNASYAEDNSTVKARAFETACLLLLRREPQQGARNGVVLTIDKQSVREELKRVRQWLAARGAANGGASSSRRISFQDFR